MNINYLSLFRIQQLPPVHVPSMIPPQHGVTKHMLEELFFHAMPALLPLVDSIVCEFGAVQDPFEPQEIASTSIALRELISGLIIASRYVASTFREALEFMWHIDHLTSRLQRNCS